MKLTTTQSFLTGNNTYKDSTQDKLVQQSMRLLKLRKVTTHVPEERIYPFLKVYSSFMNIKRYEKFPFYIYP